MSLIEGDLRSPTSARYAIVASRWNSRITDVLVTGARKTFADHDIPEDAIDVVRVPGAWEIPQAIELLTRQGGTYAAVVALGCVVRGDTRHFEQVADGTSDALMRLSLDRGVPVANGVLAVDTYDDAQARAGGAHGNKGEEAALVAIEMANLASRIGGDRG